MGLKDFIKPELIKMELESQDKEGVIKELIKLLKGQDYITDEKSVFQSAMEREQKSTTGIGNGIAIPHVKSKAVKKPAIVFGRSKKGINFQSLDKKPSYLFFLIAAPEKSKDQHLKLLAKLSRMLVHEDFREALLQVSTPEGLREVIVVRENSFK
ncbi:PTS fructose transporter subunit IIA [Iocasia frigidifontis]|uniref:PTS fructose transporter subunit IIA n=1 Tax=Iocasia fonsfrigidae TaxID=2682810 RepID=A0A8A7KDI2_9FIRM|nr:PTS sugar transporter subunit IIA [Iocasia fonsfrigidae]QTL99846.1 PTS fructose transporter subunit IIA [Iocasia fonsfrigidae]